MEVYDPIITLDPDFVKWLSMIGQSYFKIEPPKQNNLMSSIMNALNAPNKSETSV